MNRATKFKEADNLSGSNVVIFHTQLKFIKR